MSRPRRGEMRLYLNGDLIATTEVPHGQIPEKQANPFRIGAPTNPPKVGLDEIRFSQAALGPLEFLRAETQAHEQERQSGRTPPIGREANRRPERRRR